MLNFMLWAQVPRKAGAKLLLFYKTTKFFTNFFTLCPAQYRFQILFYRLSMEIQHKTGTFGKRWINLKVTIHLQRHLPADR